MQAAMPLIDSHVHLQPHGEKPAVDRGRIDAYVEQARRSGVDVVVFTEHLFRFKEAFSLFEAWWAQDPRQDLAAISLAYVDDHVNLSLSEYVSLIESAKADGLPVRLGLEMDWIPGHAYELAALIEPYHWDCILGSVHWLGAMQIDHEDCLPEWRQRNIEDVWEEYARWVEELADSRFVDVLAHPDVVKVWGFRGANEPAIQRRIVSAAARNGVALEINTNGLRKPVGELYPDPALLRQAYEAGVAVTLASDAHEPERVGQAFDLATAAARKAGYGRYVSFELRRMTAHDLPA
jgi:histidinol-phosphatase (PHP family)